MRKKVTKHADRKIIAERGAKGPFENSRTKHPRRTAAFLIPLLIVVAFACAGGNPTDNLPADCDTYVSTAETCYGMGKERALEMRQLFRSRLAVATDKSSIVSECALGVKQLSEVCHAR